MNILERLYYTGFLIKQRHALAHRERLPFMVISIGNITTGGTGKTPATMALAREALRRGLRPVILTRGYRGRAAGPCFVSRGEGPLLFAAEAGDEPYLMASSLRDVPIVKGPDRHRSGIFAIENLGPGILFLLDDGFQHLRLFRDVDIVLLDADDPFGGHKLLPSGRLREPAASLERADIIVITRSDVACQARSEAGRLTTEEGIAGIREYNKTSPVHTAGHLPVAVSDRRGRGHPLSLLAGERVFGFCGIGNPGSFRRTILDTGADLAGFREFRDHHFYGPGDLRDITREAERLGCQWIVTTEKDIIKLNHLDLPENILIIRIEFSIGSSFYDQVFEQYVSSPRGRDTGDQIHQC